jgi:hypothetical protein
MKPSAISRSLKSLILRATERLFVVTVDGNVYRLYCAET